MLTGFNVLAALKQILKWLDLDSGDPRPPNPPLASDDARQLKLGLEKIGFFEWRRGG